MLRLGALLRRGRARGLGGASGGLGLRGGLWDPRGLVGEESGDESVWMGASVSSLASGSSVAPGRGCGRGWPCGWASLEAPVFS